MKKRLVVAGVLLMGLGVSIVYALRFDPSYYRADIIAALEAETGRTVSFGERIEIEWGLRPRLRVSDFTLANPAWAREPHLLSVADAETAVSLWPLLSGRLVLKHITLRGAALRLETSAEGDVSWAMPRGDTASPAAGDSGESGSSGPAIQVDQLVVQNARVSYHDHSRGRPFAATSTSFRIVRHGARAFVATGQVETHGVHLAVSGETVESNNEPVRFAVRLTGEGIAFSASGDTSGFLEQAAPRTPIDIALDVNDTATLARLAGYAVDSAPPSTLRGRLLRQSDAWALTHVEAELGASRLTGHLALTRSGERNVLSGALVSDDLDVRPWVASTSDDMTVPGSESRLFSSRPWPVLGPPPLDVNVDLTFAQLRLPKLELRTVEGALLADEKRYALEGLQAEMFGAPTQGRLSLTPQLESQLESQLGSQSGSQSASVTFDASLKANGIDLKAAQGALGMKPSLTGRANLEGTLSANGNSVAQAASNLTGQVSLRLAGARANLGGLDALVGGITGLITAKGRAGDWTELNCGIATADFDAGTGAVKLLVDTSQAVVIGQGKLDLARESIYLIVRPEPKAVTLNLAVPVLVTGPLTSPSLRPETGETVLRLGSLVGSVLFPPAAILAFADAGANVDPCLSGAVRAASSGPSTRALRAAGSAVSSTASKASRAVGETGRQASKAVGGALNQIGKGLKNLFGN